MKKSFKIPNVQLASYVKVFNKIRTDFEFLAFKCIKNNNLKNLER